MGSEEERYRATSLLLVSLLCILWSSLGIAQELSSATLTTDWAINIKACPILLTPFQRGYQIKNRSTKTLSGYALGCVRKEENEIKIVKTLPFETILMPPGWSTGAGSIDAPVHEVIAECVGERKAKVAAVQVRFVDGKVWKLDKHSKAE